MRAGYFNSTARYSLSADAGSFVVPGTITNTYGVTTSPRPRAYYVGANQPCHIARNNSDTDASQTDLYCPANFPILIECYAGETISFVLDSAGGDSGAYVWFSQVDRT
jgi:hypothetical protein